MRFSLFTTALLAGSLFFTACNNTGKPTVTGPIVLGDSAMIITETDSTYLRDMVMDMELTAPLPIPVPDAAPAAQQPDTTTSVVAKQPEEEKKPAPVEEKKVGAPKGNGLTIDMNGVTLFIPGADGNGRGTSYQLRKGSLNGKQVQVTEGSITKISQRYQTIVVAKNNLGTLILDNLSTTSGWKALSGGGKSYAISGLEDRNLAAPKITAASTRAAVTRAGRKRKFGKSLEQKWQNSVKNARSANQRPLSVELRSVMWKLEGKDSKGKTFNKQLRIDLPV